MEWGVTEAGFGVPPPESLQLSQVVARVLRLADPVRKGATDWLPLIAVVIGALAATEAGAEIFSAIATAPTGESEARSPITRSPTRCPARPNGPRRSPRSRPGSSASTARSRSG